jgi:hypothetical protein
MDDVIMTSLPNPSVQVSDGLAGYAVKCVESKGDSGMSESSVTNDPLQELMLAILSDDTEVHPLHLLICGI